MMLPGLFFVASFLAYVNGANDNFKGVATLFGSKSANYRNALRWATVSTLAGSISSVFLADKLIQNFSGRGLVPDSLSVSPAFILAVAVGAGVTVMVATMLGLPISTTHAVTGALLGGGIVAAGTQINIAKLGGSFILPLLLGPAVSVLLSMVSHRAAQRQMRSVSKPRILDALHWVSAGSVCFARSLNDTPKIAALFAVSGTTGSAWAIPAVAVAMVCGGLISARRVAETMSLRITPLTPTLGLTANCCTAALVTSATLFGLPMSTTHVSCGSIFGVGVLTRQANKGVIFELLVAWVATLPSALLIGGGAYYVLGRI
jgi:PiT family inorganic phosphate transporter